MRFTVKFCYANNVLLIIGRGYCSFCGILYPILYLNLVNLIVSRRTVQLMLLNHLEVEYLTPLKIKQYH